ncbi:hypothetical protein Q8A67_013317 [Cirrhinus molitorella]|uniref:Uncharacterized protein n=1 Tax=Cirrhinus molitorella TaxID=172907 RepID=A0AA88PPZ3_9TELE|nr:hypothetical protein Q8A67_013317 [Cirrhinus molitorella]
MLSLSVVLRRSKNFTSRGAVRMPPAVPFNHGPGFGKPTKIEPESYSIIPSCGIQRRRAACFEHSNFFKVNVRVPPAETPSQGHPGDAARQGAGQAVVRLSTLRQPAPEDQPGSATSSFGGPGGEEREEREREGGGREPSSSSFFPHGPHGEGKALSGGRGDARDQSSLRQPRCASRGRVALGGSPGASLPPGRAGDQDPPGGRPRGRSAGGRTRASLPARTGVRATGPRNEAGVFLGRGGCHGRAEAQASAGGVAGTVPPSYPRAPSGPRAVPDRCVRPGVYASHEPLGRVGRLPHAKSEPGAPRPWRPPRRPGRDPTLAVSGLRGLPALGLTCWDEARTSGPLGARQPSLWYTARPFCFGTCRAAALDRASMPPTNLRAEAAREASRVHRAQGGRRGGRAGDPTLGVRCFPIGEQDRAPGGLTTIVRVQGLFGSVSRPPRGSLSGQSEQDRAPGGLTTIFRVQGHFGPVSRPPRGSLSGQSEQDRAPGGLTTIFRVQGHFGSVSRPPRGSLSGQSEQDRAPGGLTTIFRVQGHFGPVSRPPRGSLSGQSEQDRAPGGLTTIFRVQGHFGPVSRPPRGSLSGQNPGSSTPSALRSAADGGARSPAREGASRGLVVRPRKENEVTTQLDSPPRETPGAPTPGSIGPRGPAKPKAPSDPGSSTPSALRSAADGGARFPAREGASRGLVVRPRKENEVTTQLDSPPREMPGAPTPGSIGPRGPEIRSPKVENGQSLTRYNSAVLRPNSSKLGSLVDLRGAYQTTPTPKARGRSRSVGPVLPYLGPEFEAIRPGDGRVRNRKLRKTQVHPPRLPCARQPTKELVSRLGKVPRGVW